MVRSCLESSTPLPGLIVRLGVVISAAGGVSGGGRIIAGGGGGV